MSALTLLGLGAGVGLVMVAMGLARSRSALATALERYRRSAELVGFDPAGPRAPRSDARQLLAGLGDGLDRLSPAAWRSRRAQDLEITGRSLEAHSAAAATATLLGASGPLLAVGLFTRLAGLSVSVAVPVALAFAGAAVGFVAPQLGLRRAAGEARRGFRRALSCWLELVVLAQAGGMGVESALEAASRITDEPSCARLRDALQRARAAGQTPWEGLARLGRDIGVEDLEELAASLGLAGVEGARIRASLAAKADSLRRRQMTDAEAAANATTERLFLPSIVLMVGFMVFLMYPAGVSLAHVL